MDPSKECGTVVQNWKGKGYGSNRIEDPAVKNVKEDFAGSLGSVIDAGQINRSCLGT